MDYHVPVTHVATQTTAVLRRHANLATLPTTIPQSSGEMWDVIHACQPPNPGRNFVLYLDAAWHLEGSMDVPAPFAGRAHAGCSSTPAGLAATAVHHRPDGGLGEAHAPIRRWCTAHDDTQSGWVA
jgi:hypothetical protein